MNSRQRIEASLNYRPTDRIPVDLGSTVQTGMAVDVVAQLRDALKLEARPVKIVDPYGMLGQLDDDLLEALGIDTTGLWPPETAFGFSNTNWKPWPMANGIEVLVPEKFNIEPEPNGSLYQYPQGDRSVAPSAMMPKNGFYFDSIDRQLPIDEDALGVQDNLEDFVPLTDEQLHYYATEAEQLYHDTDRAIMALVYGTNFGDPGYLTAPWRVDPKGIRSTEEWYMSLLIRDNYVKDLFSGQCEMAIQNLHCVYQAVGDKITVINVCANDLGTQRSPLVRTEIYEELFMPVHKKINDGVHEHTNWKTFFHSCGAIGPLLPAIVEAGFDILNSVQCSACGMEPEPLKQAYGDKIVFWGGGVDTQKTLPFGTAQEVYQEVCERIQILNRGGGVVFCPVHCIQSGTPVENILAMFDAIRDASNQ